MYLRRGSTHWVKREIYLAKTQTLVNEKSSRLVFEQTSEKENDTLVVPMNNLPALDVLNFELGCIHQMNHIFNIKILERQLWDLNKRTKQTKNYQMYQHNKLSESPSTKKGDPSTACGSNLFIKNSWVYGFPNRTALFSVPTLH